MAAEVEVYEGEQDGDVELTTAQVQALEKLDAAGEGLPDADPDNPGKWLYHPNSQIRALQLIAQGRLGGAGRGQGRKRKPRVGEYVAEEMRKRGAKIVAAIDQGLDSDNEKVALSAADMAVRIDRDETLVDLKQQEVDNVDNLSKEELIDAIIQLASEPATSAQLEAVIDIPEEDIQEVEAVVPQVKARKGKDNSGDSRVAGRARAASRPSPSRAHAREAKGNGARSASRIPREGANPITALARGRATD